MIWSHILTNFMPMQYYHFDVKSYSHQFLTNATLSLWYEVIFSPISCQWNTIVMIWSHILTNFLPMEYYHYDMKSYSHQFLNGILSLWYEVIFSPISCQWNIIIMIGSHILTNLLPMEYYLYDMKSYSHQFLAIGILSLWYEVIFSPISCQWNTIIMIWSHSHQFLVNGILSLWYEVIFSPISCKCKTIIMIWSHILTNFLPMKYYHYDMKSYSHQFLANGILSLWYEVIFSPISCRWNIIIMIWSHILTNFLPMEYYHYDMKSYPHKFLENGILSLWYEVICSPISCQWNTIIMIWSHILTNFMPMQYYHYDVKSYSHQFLANGILSLWYEVIFSPISCQYNTIIMIWSHILTNFLSMEYYHYEMKSYSHQFLANGILSLWYEIIFSPISCQWNTIIMIWSHILLWSCASSLYCQCIFSVFTMLYPASNYFLSQFT